jgi:nucleotide-binding universal stress UspA family protein
MLSIKKILVTTDFSGPSYKGLDAAVDLAALFHAELAVVHVLPVLPPTPSDPNISFEVPEFEAILHKDSIDKLHEIIKTRVPAGIKAEEIIGHGNAAKEIIRIAEEAKADLIVIATQGHTGWSHLLLGSVAEKVIRHARCPVFCVREQPA